MCWRGVYDHLRYTARVMSTCHQKEKPGEEDIRGLCVAYSLSLSLSPLSSPHTHTNQACRRQLEVDLETAPTCRLRGGGYM